MSRHRLANCFYGTVSRLSSRKSFGPFARSGSLSAFSALNIRLLVRLSQDQKYLSFGCISLSGQPKIKRRIDYEDDDDDEDEKKGPYCVIAFVKLTRLLKNEMLTVFPRMVSFKFGVEPRPLVESPGAILYHLSKRCIGV